MAALRLAGRYRTASYFGWGRQRVVASRDQEPKDDRPGQTRRGPLQPSVRARESADDEAFVVKLCHQMGVPCELGKTGADLLQERGGEGLEAVARRARYEFLEQTAARIGARYVVTAHTADDQVENDPPSDPPGYRSGRTFRHGPGKAACEATTLIRPLLGVRRAEVLAYLADLGQPYRNDSSNDDTRFTPKTASATSCCPSWPSGSTLMWPTPFCGWVRLCRRGASGGQTGWWRSWPNGVSRGPARR